MKTGEAYKLNNEEIHSQLLEIKVLLDEHNKTATAELIDWGHVSDLGFVSEKLQEIIHFMRNED